MTLWAAVLVTAAGCYLLKYAGLAAPRALLEHPLVRRFALAVPVALLAALIALQTVADGNRWSSTCPGWAGWPPRWRLCSCAPPSSSCSWSPRRPRRACGRSDWAEAPEQFSTPGFPGGAADSECPSAGEDIRSGGVTGQQ